MYGTRLYRTWDHMKSRCENGNDKKYYLYGGRGIKLCAEWHDASVFICWALKNGYSEDLTIDRIDPNGNYCPENCRWATQKEQGNNKRNNLFITINGTTRTATQWEDALGLRRNVVHNRVNRGWSPEKAVLVPVRATRRTGGHQ